VTHSTPKDPRRRAFAEALGHAIAEAVWRDITGAEVSPKNTDPRQTGQAERGSVKEREDAGRKAHRAA
jgi:hypothetical protein